MRAAMTESSSDYGPRAHAFTTARRKKRSPASSSSGVLPWGLTFCHHCRRKTPLPKMRCTLIKASTDDQCSNLFCDLCIEKRYPQLTFDRSAEDSSVQLVETIAIARFAHGSVERRTSPS
ncbi:hypothetical protein EDB84DRAFT_1577853, partial [Lactarius hengduanensis]